jgi:hypothetical protein
MASTPQWRTAFVFAAARRVSDMEDEWFPEDEWEDEAVTAENLLARD